MRRARGLARSLEPELGGTVQAVVQGIMGPRRHACTDEEGIAPEEARKYRREQRRELKEGGAGPACATAEAVAEAMGAGGLQLELVVAGALGSGGRLPRAEAVGEAGRRVNEGGDRPRSSWRIAPSVGRAEGWVERLGGVRAKASAKSRGELGGGRERRGRCAGVGEGGGARSPPGGRVLRDWGEVLRGTCQASGR